MFDNYYITPAFDTPVEGGNTVKLNPSRIAQGNESWAAWTWNEGAEGDAYWAYPDADLVFTNLMEKVIFVRYDRNSIVSLDTRWNQTDDLDVIDGHTFTLTHFGEYGTAMYGTRSNVILTWLDYSRNRWTDDEGNLYPNGNTDLLYTDFEIAFEDGANQIFDEEGEILNGYSVGVCFELCDRWPRTAYPGDTTFVQGTDYNYSSNEAHLKTAIASGVSGNYCYTDSTDSNNGGKRRSYQLSAIPTTSLTNRIRIQFAKAYKNAYKVNGSGDITGYTNSTYLMKATAYLMKATAYLIAPDGYVMLSNPVYICLTDIAAYDSALSENIVVLTDSVETIGDYAFSGCTALDSITIPATVTEIGENAFDGCPWLTIYGATGSAAQLYAEANGIPFIDPDALQDAPLIRGDADCDGKVTILDATCIQRRLAALYTAKYNALSADADGDGSVNILDATRIQRFLADFHVPGNIGQPIA